MRLILIQAILFIFYNSHIQKTCEYSDSRYTIQPLSDGNSSSLLRLNQTDNRINEHYSIKTRWRALQGKPMATE